MEGEAQVTSSESSQSESAASSNGRTSEFGSENTGSSPEAASTESTQQSETKPAGFDPVDVTTASPEQIKARIDRLYANVKRSEGDTKELREQNQALMRSLEQLYQGQNQIVNHLQTNDYVEAENNLKSQRDNAWKNGDLDGYHKANDAMIDIRARKAYAENQAKQQPKQQQQRPNTDGERMVDRAMQANEISPVDANIARSWMAETDQVGNIKRSWTQSNDPRNYEAALVGKAVFESPAWIDRPMGEKLREIDRRMGTSPQSQQSGQNVMGAGNLTRGARGNNIKLTDVERTIAVKTKFGGSKAKSDEDHAAAYLQAKIKSQPKGATR